MSAAWPECGQLLEGKKHSEPVKPHVKWGAGGAWSIMGGEKAVRRLGEGVPHTGCGWGRKSKWRFIRTQVIKGG